MARNEGHPESDIDILIDLDYEAGADFFLFMEMQEPVTSRGNDTQFPFLEAIRRFAGPVFIWKP